MIIITYLYLIGALILGLLYCFRGYSSLKTYVGIYLFFTGSSWMYEFLGAISVGHSETWLWVLSILTGIALAFLAFKFMRFAIFVAGGLMGVAVYRIFSFFNPVFFGSLGSLMVFVVGLVFFIVFGALTLALERHFIIWGTAIWGAYTAVAAGGILVGFLMHSQSVPQIALGTSLSALQSYSIFSSIPTAATILMVVLVILGIIRQYRKSGKRKHR